MNLFEEIVRIKEVMNRSSKNDSLPIISLENDLVSTSELLKKLEEESLDPNQKFVLKAWEFSISDNDLDLVPGLQKVIGNVNLRYNTKSLAGLKEIEGDFFVGSNVLDNFGNLNYIAGDLNMTNSRIKSETLGNIHFVGGDIFAYRSNLRSLGDLKFVGGDANLSHSSIIDLNNLKYVGGTLGLYRTPIDRKFSYEEIKKITHNIDYGDLNLEPKF